MSSQRELRFGAFRLDPTRERLWRGATELRLRPKSFAVLTYLVQRHGRLVSKDEILEALWPGLAVDEGALTTCLGEIRRALGDDPRQPRFIETVHRRGYRVIAPILMAGAGAGNAVTGGVEEGQAVSLSPQSSSLSPTQVVGREAELYRLKGELLLTQEGTGQKAQGKNGKRQRLAFVRLSTLPAARGLNRWSCARR